MASFKTVDEYLAVQLAAARTVLRRVRTIIRKAVPGAEETISYQIPAYKLRGSVVIYFAGWKEHYALYPATGRVAVELRDEIAPFKASKGTLRFLLSKPVPVRLIARIAKIRAQEAAARAGVKPGIRRR